MFSLLTGRHSDADPTQPMTTTDHLAAMRRILAEASKRLSGGQPYGVEAAAVMVGAARVHAEAAKSAPMLNAEQLKAAGLKPAPPARRTPRDGDAL